MADGFYRLSLRRAGVRANIIAAIFTRVALIVAARPPDREHAYGHAKIEYFSTGIEGGLIFVAALVIAVQAGQRLLNPQPLEEVGLGVVLSAVAGDANSRQIWIHTEP